MQAVENYQRKKIEEVSNTAPICVLHVDDDPSILEISKQILVDMGNFDIDHASCVEEAFKKLASGHYDVVISDYEMPQKDGLQFLKELRKQNNEIPFILFTGKGREEVAIKALNLGADGYINKQGDPETVYGELTHEIAQLANQNRLKLELAEGEDRFRHFFTNIPNAVVVYEVVEDGEDFVLMDINFAAEKIEHISKAHVIGKRVTAVFPGAKEFGVLEVFKRVWKTGQSEYFPAAFYHDKRDSGSWRENWIFKLPNSNIVDIYRDITERVKAELELKQSNEALERVAESIDSGLAVIGRDYEVVWANKRLMDLGVASNKKCYQTFNRSKTICPDCGVKKIFEQNVSLDVHEYKTVNSKGETVWVELRVTPLKDKNGNVTAALELAVPITERKKVEEKIQFQADLLNRIGQAIIMVDNNRTIRYWNNAAEKLYGWPEKQALGRKVIEILGGTSQEEASEITKRLMAGESWSTEVLAKNKDGSFVPIIVNRSPIFNQDGAFVGAASIATDITLQKNAEADLTFALNSFSNSLDKIQELNEKLRVVGSLTRHDVRNKLSVVTGYAYLLNKKHAEEADIVDGLGKMEQAVKDSLGIFEFAKTYEQLGVEELTYINVEEKLNEAASLFSEQLPKIMNECHGLMVLADSFLRQLFYNFIDNTRKYGKTANTIRVYYEKEENDTLRLIYLDDGGGISAEDKLKLFKEGFSTGGSTGFGLFLSKKMIDVYGWEIKETGEPGKGAKFMITIPKTNQNGQEHYQIQPAI